MDFLALIIASFTLPAVVGALAIGAIGYLAWGWLGALIGVLIGYFVGAWWGQSFSGDQLSPYAKGWVSLAVFIGGLAVLAIATR